MLPRPFPAGSARQFLERHHFIECMPKKEVRKALVERKGAPLRSRQDQLRHFALRHTHLQRALTPHSRAWVLDLALLALNRSRHWRRSLN
jgi:hypothetical protein